MKHAASALFALSIACTQAAAGTLAGAPDGQYLAQDGSFILIDSSRNAIGIQLLSCDNPVVSAGRLKTEKCQSNRYPSDGIDVSWRVAGNSIYSEGKRHVWLPPMGPWPKFGKPDPFDPTPDAWGHNGSSVRVDPATGKITYIWVKPALKGVVKPGAVIFEGGVRTDGRVIGTAYAFKQGCPPASYPVRGVYSKGNEELILTGPGPKREGCEVVAYSWDSPHSKLVFDYVVGD